MKYITEDIADTEYAVDLRTFLTAAEENAQELGLTAQELSELTEEVTRYDGFVANVYTARAQYAASVTEKEIHKKQLRRKVNDLARIWRANPSLSPGLLEMLMVAPREVKRSLTTPHPIRDLVVDANATGTIFLTWHANGNIKRTQYVIEMAHQPTGPWVQVATETARKFKYQGTPGVGVWFRVTAKRRGIFSAPSLPVSMWTGTRLAQAA